MKAFCWHSKEDIRADTIPDPEIMDAHEAIVRITSTAIRDSNLQQGALLVSPSRPKPSVPEEDRIFGC